MSSRMGLMVGGLMAVMVMGLSNAGAARAKAPVASTNVVPLTAAGETEKIVFMKSALGGLQLHYNRTGEPETFEYVVEVPAAGPYALSARVVTVTGDQHLLVSVNGAETPVDITLPFTVGMWGQSAPVTVPLAKGRNVLVFSRGGDNIRGVTIKDFVLKK